MYVIAPFTWSSGQRYHNISHSIPRQKSRHLYVTASMFERICFLSFGNAIVSASQFRMLMRLRRSGRNRLCLSVTAIIPSLFPLLPRPWFGLVAPLGGIAWHFLVHHGQEVVEWYSGFPLVVYYHSLTSEQEEQKGKQS